MITLFPTPDDDESFLQLVTSVIRKVAGSVQPNDCYAVTLDNWFDHKWLLWPGQDPWARGSIHERTPVPCFNPSRVVTQLHYVRVADSPEYTVATETKAIHGYDGWYPRKRHRRLSDFSNSGVFVWYSSGTATTGRGSLMAYMNTGVTRSAWYASFQRGDQIWTVAKCKSISRREVESLVRDTGSPIGKSAC